MKFLGNSLLNASSIWMNCQIFIDVDHSFEINRKNIYHKVQLLLHSFTVISIACAPIRHKNKIKSPNNSAHIIFVIVNSNGNNARRHITNRMWWKSVKQTEDKKNWHWRGPWHVAHFEQNKTDIRRNKHRSNFYTPKRRKIPRLLIITFWMGFVRIC